MKGDKKPTETAVSFVFLIAKALPSREMYQGDDITKQWKSNEFNFPAISSASDSVL
jgi:hypothetical protein